MAMVSLPERSRKNMKKKVFALMLTLCMDHDAEHGVGRRWI